MTATLSLSHRHLQTFRPVSDGQPVRLPRILTSSCAKLYPTGAIYYSTLLVAEAFGQSGEAQIVDLYMNSNNPLTPGYAIFENGNPVRVVLFNYIDDSTGANDYTANIAIGGQQTGLTSTTPSSVQVRYMRADALGSHNVTWAGRFEFVFRV